MLHRDVPCPHFCQVRNTVRLPRLNNGADDNLRFFVSEFTRD